ncbi:hypothetical protein N7539_007516 [Penicillium diatomitis]|uniref:Uncharacterized protein n=1 Tax=Penicillium diatomitis TaxID=2819901 RepID=A0A9W9WVE7_9EURO|nr:uncharacterized protein N7539_007516 [Penicillium diatomitis]KAJ5477372.1 hypothetical protein N7539_007516 [Penicillium diatomitis]
MLSPGARIIQDTGDGGARGQVQHEGGGGFRRGYKFGSRRRVYGCTVLSVHYTVHNYTLQLHTTTTHYNYTLHTTTTHYNYILHKYTLHNYAHATSQVRQDSAIVVDVDGPNDAFDNTHAPFPQIPSPVERSRHADASAGTLIREAQRTDQSEDATLWTAYLQRRIDEGNVCMPIIAPKCFEKARLGKPANFNLV